MKEIKINAYSIKWLDEDYIEVSHEYNDNIVKAKICGGDFETFLGIFLANPEITQEFK